MLAVLRMPSSHLNETKGSKRTIAARIIFVPAEPKVAL